VGDGLGIKDGLCEGTGVVGNFDGAGVGMLEGAELGDGLGISEGEAEGIGVVGA